ncbi:hypothetical protein evm_007701 [Chilo suppressalis]|nr:hypothetical protein evm_007701 [Chilo suppressalis]
MDKLPLVFLLIICAELKARDEINASENRTIEPSKVLSRRKRFLVFPEGSSFQLVFEHQNHGYMMIGDIVWFATTAALAWELPSDPDTFYLLKNHKKHYGQRRQDSKNILFLDEDGKVIGRKPYKRRIIVNPAFAKRSVHDENDPRENNFNKELTKKEMHETEINTDRFKDLDVSRVEFHRETRRSLYEKVENVFKGFGWNGRECVLRLLCETGKRGRGQGTFLEEILRATFTLPKGREFGSAAHKEYDIAHGTRGDCIALYPDCRSASVK